MKQDKWTYDKWIEKQVANILIQIRPLSLAGRYDCAVYAFRSNGAEEGYLSVCEEQPADACDVVRFAAHGSRIMSVPCTALPSLLWHACRHLPICPTA